MKVYLPSADQMNHYLIGVLLVNLGITFAFGIVWVILRDDPTSFVHTTLPMTGITSIVFAVWLLSYQQNRDWIKAEFIDVCKSGRFFEGACVCAILVGVYAVTAFAAIYLR